MLLDKQTYDDFRNRLDEIDSLLDKGKSPYITMAAAHFAALEGDLSTIFPDGRIYTIENDNFVERLLEVWNRLKNS